MISVNRGKAEEIVRERLRIEREPRLAALDLEVMRGLESGADTSAIVSQKQALRDVTEKDLSGLDLDRLGALTLDQALTL